MARVTVRRGGGDCCGQPIGTRAPPHGGGVILFQPSISDSVTRLGNDTLNRSFRGQS